jgi:hypothetical protein
LPETKAVTFYGFCDQFLRSRGERLDYQQISQPGFWRDVQDRVLAAPIPDDWTFDVLIVDEGQDFEPDWLEILELFLSPGGRILWLEDPEQNLQCKPPALITGFVRLRATSNYRTPYAIARFMRDHLPTEFEPANPLPRLGVDLHSYHTEQDQTELLAKIIRDLQTQGFEPADIAVISLRGLSQSPVLKLDRIGTLPLRRFTGDYTPEGAQI